MKQHGDRIQMLRTVIEAVLCAAVSAQTQNIPADAFEKAGCTRNDYSRRGVPYSTAFRIAVDLERPDWESAGRIITACRDSNGEFWAVWLLKVMLDPFAVCVLAKCDPAEPARDFVRSKAEFAGLSDRDMDSMMYLEELGDWRDLRLD